MGNNDNDNFGGPSNMSNAAPSANGMTSKIIHSPHMLQFHVNNTLAQMPSEEINKMYAGAPQMIPHIQNIVALHNNIMSKIKPV